MVHVNEGAQNYKVKVILIKTFFKIQLKLKELRGIQRISYARELKCSN